MNENLERSEISGDLLQNTEKARAPLLPTKSEPKYEKKYDKFLQWLKVNRIENKNISEFIMLADFQDMSESYSPNSLWTKWSMLKSVMTVYNNTDGRKFHDLEAFLKRKSKGYEAKKSKVFSRDDIVKFLKTGSDEEHLLHMVVLIMGYLADSMELKNKTARMSAGMSHERSGTSTSCLTTVIGSDNSSTENSCNSGNNFS